MFSISLFRPAIILTGPQCQVVLAYISMVLAQTFFFTRLASFSFSLFCSTNYTTTTFGIPYFTSSPPAHVSLTLYFFLESPIRGMGRPGKDWYHCGTDHCTAKNARRSIHKRERHT